jgi:hypothetical protein
MFGFEYYFYLQNESETDYNPRKLGGPLLSLFTNAKVKKSKADTKVKKPYDRNFFIC